MRCPTCGAHNPASAAWCGQCYARLDGPPAGGPSAAGDPPAVDAGGTPRSAHPATDRAADPPDPADAATDHRPVRTRDDDVEWRCPTCAAWTPLAVAACSVCGTARQGFEVAAAPTRPVVTAPRPVLVAATLVVPGVGHLLAGRTGTGLARALLAGLWGIAGIALVARGAGAAGWTLLAGWGVLLVASLLDLPTVDRHPPELLTPRRLGILVALVTGLLLLAFTVLGPVAGG